MLNVHVLYLYSIYKRSKLIFIQLSGDKLKYKLNYKISVAFHFCFVVLVFEIFQLLKELKIE